MCEYRDIQLKQICSLTQAGHILHSDQPEKSFVLARTCTVGSKTQGKMCFSVVLCVVRAVSSSHFCCAMSDFLVQMKLKSLGIKLDEGKVSLNISQPF